MGNKLPLRNPISTSDISSQRVVAFCYSHFGAFDFLLGGVGGGDGGLRVGGGGRDYCGGAEGEGQGGEGVVCLTPTVHLGGREGELDGIL